MVFPHIPGARFFCQPCVSDSSSLAFFILLLLLNISQKPKPWQKIAVCQYHCQDYNLSLSTRCITPEHYDCKYELLIAMDVIFALMLKILLYLYGWYIFRSLVINLWYLPFSNEPFNPVYFRKMFGIGGLQGYDQHLSIPGNKLILKWWLIPPYI